LPESSEPLEPEPLEPDPEEPEVPEEPEPDEPEPEFEPSSLPLRSPPWSSVTVGGVAGRARR
jgi:hypothetical protein